WPFSTLGWPNLDSKDLNYWYPTSVLVTGYDIIFFWVARMIFSALEYTGEIPFDTVLIHGLVRDAQGRKMSKSLGNGIDPLEIIEKYGADALRFALATGNSPGNDMRFSDEKIEAARNFANKLWNAARFVMMNLEIEQIQLPPVDRLAAEDKWILARLNETIASVRSNLDNYEIGIALSALYDFVWDVYCDWYIELSKASVAMKGTERSLDAQNVLAYVLCKILALLHPFMPFITEEIYRNLPGTTDSIMAEEYPTVSDAFRFPEDEIKIARVIDAITAIRARRSEMNVPPSRKAQVFIVTKYPDSFPESTHAFFTRMASASAVSVVDSFADEGAVQIITDAATIYIPLSDMVDFEAERKRLNAELTSMENEIKRAESKLANESFVARAPQQVVDAEKAKLEKYKAQRDGILDALKAIEGK
ncbi:MAG: class I tRNA ligase family protein, partial [Clostridia bacterium]|nr:class I tRNA ligase family protein [Clostridia bacterium]